MATTPASRPDEGGEVDLLPLRRPLVAVLPFQAVEDDEAMRLLGAELADAVREGLGRAPAVRAILISSEFLQRAPEHAIELICRHLGVGHLVSGRCHGTPVAPSLYVELCDTRDWHVRCARFFRGNAHDLLAEGSPAMASLQALLQESLVSSPMH